MSDLGLRLFRHAIQVGFDKLNVEQLAEIASFEEGQLRALAGRPDSADRTARARLHLAIRELATKTAARRKAAA